MKELSIEEKAKAYDEAIERAKGVIEQNPLMEYLKKGIEYIFPELKESDDERIRKALIELVQGIYKGCCTEEAGKERDMFLTWLEKQGEQKPILDVEIPFGAKDSELQEASYHIPEGFHAEIEGNKVIIKRGEQKPAWSDEDESNATELCGLVIETYKIEDANVLIDWLKSLKDRYTWKPSESDIYLLERIVQGKSNPRDFQASLTALIIQLKKLKEE